MTDSPIQIRKEDVVRDIRALAELTKQPITEAVALAVRTELQRVRRSSGADRQQRRRAVRAALARFRRAPTIGPLLTDADLYDADGMPR